MAGESIGAVKQLVVLLRRYFTPSGIPPRPAELSCLLATQDCGKVTDDEYRTARASVDFFWDEISFASLIADPPDPFATEVMEHLPTLSEIAATLRDVKQSLISEAGRERYRYLFDKLLEQDVFTDLSVGVRKKNRNGPEELYVTFVLKPIDEPFISDLEVSDFESRTLAEIMETDKDEQDIMDLLRSVGHRLTTMQLLDEFNRRNNPKAGSTLKAKLSSLVKRRILTTSHLHKPGGYGLPEW